MYRSSTLLHAVPEFKLRIVNSSVSNPSMGRLEIFHNDKWGTICDDYFDINATQVACRMLGFGGALDFYPNAVLGQGATDEPIWLDDVVCETGTETSFYECNKANFGINNCRHTEDVGIACFSEFFSPISCIPECMVVGLCVHAVLCNSTYVHLNTHTHTHKHTHTRARAHTHTHTHAHTHTQHTHTHTHTHTHLWYVCTQAQADHMRYSLKYIQYVSLLVSLLSV